MSHVLLWDDGDKLGEYVYHSDGAIQREIHEPLTKKYAYDADRNLTGLSIRCSNNLWQTTATPMTGTETVWKNGSFPAQPGCV